MEGLYELCMCDSGSTIHRILITAALQGHEQCALRLIEAGADVNAKSRDGFTATMGAANSESVEILSALLEAGTDVNAWYFGGRWATALIIAVERQNTNIVDLLIKAGADVNVKSGGKTVLKRSVDLKNIEIICKLVETGAVDDAQTDEGLTALMQVAANAVQLGCKVCSQTVERRSQCEHC